MIIRLDNYVPRPKQRPRLGNNGNVYSPSSTEEKNLGKLIRYFAGNKEFTSDIFVGLEIITQKRLRGDIDNYEKFILVAQNKS